MFTAHNLILKRKHLVEYIFIFVCIFIVICWNEIKLKCSNLNSGNVQAITNLNSRRKSNFKMRELLRCIKEKFNKTQEEEKKVAKNLSDYKSNEAIEWQREFHDKQVCVRFYFIIFFFYFFRDAFRKDWFESNWVIFMLSKSIEFCIGHHNPQSTFTNRCILITTA